MKTRGTLAAGVAAAAGLALSATANAQYEIVNSIAGTFTDISGTGTSLGSVSDDSVFSFSSSVGNALFPAGTVTVCSNGWLCAGSATAASYGNVPIPATGIPVPAVGLPFTTGTNGYLLPFWDDLDPDPDPNGQTLYWQEIGGVLIVQWNNISHFSNAAGATVTFQVQVFSNPGAGQPHVQFLYPDPEFGGTHAANDFGASATVGYFNDANGNAGNVQWSANSAVITPNTVLSFIPLTGVGACCLSDGSCIAATSGGCAAQGGVFSGAGSSCGTVVCPGPVCYSATGLGLSIIDGGPTNGQPGPVTEGLLSVSASGTINNLKAGMVVSHTWQGDLQVKLVHPDTTEIELVGRPGVAPPKYTPGTTTGFGFTTDNYGNPTTGAYITFDDAGSTVFDNAVGFPGPPAGSAVEANNPTGTFKPTGGTMAAAFNGKSITGDWRLVITDNAGGDLGTLEAFRICLPPSTGPTCYPNCDGSTINPCLNVADFNCFLNAFAGGDPYANCDASTIPPVLNVADFSCFLNAFTGGCSSC